MDNTEDIITVPAGGAVDKNKDLKAPAKLTVLDQLKEEISKETKIIKHFLNLGSKLLGNSQAIFCAPPRYSTLSDTYHGTW